METVTLKKSLLFDCPDGFHIMSRDELKKLYLDSYRNRAGVWDTKRHLIVSVFRNKPLKLFYKMSDEKAAADGIRNLFRKKMPEYKEGKSVETAIAGQRASGFDYTYRVKGVAQEASVYVFKHKGYVYTVYCYARAPLTKDDAKILRGILDSMRTLCN